MSKIHEITPDVSLFGKLGARSRAFPMVVTELVDNSLDSWIALPSRYKKNGLLEVDITAKVGKSAWFIIKDNAGGMNMDQLVSAMTVAKSDKTNDSRFIGHFGLGLKSAAMYIGARFRIFTMHYDNPKVVNFVEFDREKFEASGEWKLKFESMEAKEAAKLDVVFGEGHGTEIQIRNDRYNPGSKGSILNRLSRVFGPRLPKNPKVKNTDEFPSDMTVTFNEDKVFAAGPFYEYWDNSARKVEEITTDFLRRLKKDDKVKNELTTDYIKGGQEDVAIIPVKVGWIEDIPAIMKIPEIKINGKSVYGRVGILDRGMAHQNKYGFDLIKNGRVIEDSVLDKDIRSREIGLVASNHNARIAGQLFLDDWKTDHQKTSFLKDTDDWIKLTEHVAKYSKGLLGISSNLQNPNKMFKDQHFDENAPEAIAEKKFEEKIPTIERGVQKAVRSGALKTALSDIEKEKVIRKESKRPEPKQVTESTTTLTQTKPHIKYSRKGEHADMVVMKVVKERSGNVLEITLNRDHPFLAQRESFELSPIGEFIAVDYFATYIVRSKDQLNHEDFLKLREELLKESYQKK